MRLTHWACILCSTIHYYHYNYFWYSSIVFIGWFSSRCLSISSHEQSRRKKWWDYTKDHRGTRSMFIIIFLIARPEMNIHLLLWYSKDYFDIQISLYTSTENQTCKILIKIKWQQRSFCSMVVNTEVL